MLAGYDGEPMAAEKSSISKAFDGARPPLTDEQGAAELAQAVKNKDHVWMKELIEAGVDPDICASFGDNASLIYLSTANDVEGMKILIDACADVNLVSPLVRKTPLLNAATHGCREACKLLIDSGADENIRFEPKISGATAIDFARQTPGLAEYIEELVKERAYARANPPPPDVTLPQDITVTKPLQLKRAP
ncbi:MAG: ankyrin repeat domain-containing protein [Alphaproteobacteria bacterium]|nr:MAG: ankyrin repeat domain-containing protein [Alphaproteobacteria bacterium]